MAPTPRMAIAPTHPARLRALASVHGLGKAALGEFRYLELRCGGGDNLLPLAQRLPLGRFTGVDDEPRLALARAAATRCELANVTFSGEHELEPGAFDFVVAHGSYSWLARDEQAKLLATIARSLAPTGVALVSYNTLPGWSIRGALRQTMLRAVGHRDSDGRLLPDGLYAARARLTKVARHVHSSHPYRALLALELELARGRADAALAEDMLAEHNEPLAFGDVMARTAEHELDLVCETLPATPDGALELTVVPELMAEGLGRIEAEECLDVLCYRQLRATLLCKSGLPIAATRDYRHLCESGRFAARLGIQTESPRLEPGTAIAFVTAGGVVIEVERPLLKAALMVLGERYPHGLTGAELHREATERLRLARVSDDETAATPASAAELLEPLVALVRRHHVELLDWTPTVHRELSSTPRLFELARLELSRGPVATNARHEPEALEALEVALAQLLDGTRDRQALVHALADRIDAGALVVDGLPAGTERRAALAPRVLGGVVRLRDLGLLV